MLSRTTSLGYKSFQRYPVKKTHYNSNKYQNQDLMSSSHKDSKPVLTTEEQMAVCESLLVKQISL